MTPTKIKNNTSITSDNIPKQSYLTHVLQEIFALITVKHTEILVGNDFNSNLLNSEMYSIKIYSGKSEREKERGQTNVNRVSIAVPSEQYRLRYDNPCAL